MENLKLLVKAAQAHDLDAYGQLVRRFQDMAYGFAYSILGDFHLAEDAAQEAFVEAFRQLAQLDNPDAFGGWFRRIVFKHCDRITRKKDISTATLDTAAEMKANEADPAMIAEKREMKEKVLETIHSLAQHQRTATTLFYINGYSHKEIAQFLEVPTTTVKKRLHDSRRQLKERMINMVEETLKDNVPNERFSKKVIEKLLALPKPLEIKGHPVQEALEIICKSLPAYKMVKGEEIIKKSDFVAAGGSPELVYHVDADKVLRRETTIAAIQAMIGRTPPVRIFTTGRVFRPGPLMDDTTHLKAYHELDFLCIEARTNLEAMKKTLRTAIESVVGPVEIKYTRPQGEFTYFEQSLIVSIKYGDKWLNIAGCGMLTVKILKKGGFDPQSVNGFGFGLGLDRLAMLKYNLDDIRKLWQPPYVPE